MKKPQYGVSLIELCVVLAIIAILYAQAAPNFAAWIHNSQIRTATESMQNGLQLARAEAIRRNRTVIFWLTAGADAAPADWLVGCLNPVGAGVQPEAAGDCPGSAVSTTTAPTSYNWIQRQTAANQQTPLPQVTELNGATFITFNSLGLVVNPNGDGSLPISRLDVTDPTLPTNLVRPLRILVGGGQIRMCDPALTGSGDPRGC
jgi:type IV fimbrial biogenesis protein FimT